MSASAMGNKRVVRGEDVQTAVISSAIERSFSASTQLSQEARTLLKGAAIVEAVLGAGASMAVRGMEALQGFRASMLIPEFRAAVLAHDLRRIGELATVLANGGHSPQHIYRIARSVKPELCQVAWRNILNEAHAHYRGV